MFLTFKNSNHDYVSMNSKRIINNNGFKQRGNYNSGNSGNSGSDNMSNVSNATMKNEHQFKNTFKNLHNMQYLIFYLEFNYFNLIKSSKEYLMSVYPELNLIVLIELDDDVNTQQKIVLVRSEKNDERNKYIPMQKQNDMIKKTGYRYLRFLSYANSHNYKSSHKLKIQLCTYSNEKLSIFSEEDIYFETNPSHEIHKFQFSTNMSCDTVMKNMGNVILSFMYKMEYTKTPIDKDSSQNDYMTTFSVIFLILNFLCNYITHLTQ